MPKITLSSFLQAQPVVVEQLRVNQGMKISFNLALACQRETATSKKKSGTDQKFVANSVYEIQSILFIIHETVSRNLNVPGSPQTDRPTL